MSRIFTSHAGALQSLSLCLLVVLFTASESHAAPCESLQALSLSNTTITLAQSVAAASFTSPAPGRGGVQPTAAFKQLPAFCRVAATLTPSTDSDIKIEVWMPLANWNGKFMAVGNGGLAGCITFAAAGGGWNGVGLNEALERGYATASTDTGHTGNTAAPFFGHPEKLVDFAYRAVHEMTVTAKAIVRAFYDTSPRLSYWNGCSLGGRQGLVEAQRFPDDYDGIIAGAPAISQTRLVTWITHVGHAALKEPQYMIPSSKYPMVHRAVMNACDAIDGTKDGLIDDPGSCRFDFKTIECKGEDAVSCLTTAQVATAQTITNPLLRPKTGETIFAGLALGTELGWGLRIGGPQPQFFGPEYLKYVFYKDPNWDWRTFDLDGAIAVADRADYGMLNATDPDLRGFQRRGGKLLLYHGWSDANFSAQQTINYYETMRDAFGSERSGESARLFLAPGMGHCGGGNGPNVFDPVAALEQWVEHGRAPESIIATHTTDGKVDRTRPLVLLSTGREVQRNRKHRRGGEFHVPASVARLSRIFRCRRSVGGGAVATDRIMLHG
jgi:feruloyl esterase